MIATNSTASLIITSLSCAFVSIATVLRAQQYFSPFPKAGTLTIFFLLTFITIGWIILWPHVLTRRSVDEKKFFFTAFSLWAVISFITVYFYPLINSCQLYSGGSDRDEALDVATRSLLDFSYPYLAKLKVAACNINIGPGGNPISPMPGELCLAIPFVLIGASAWQNLFWLLAWMFILRDLLSSWRNVDGLFFLVVLSPTVFAAELLTGGDLLAISLQAFVCAYLVWRVKGSTWLHHLILPAFLGIALSSRPQMILVLPLLLALLRDTQGWQEARIKTVVAASSWGLITLPFYFANPANFSPLHANKFFERFSNVLPYSQWYLVVLMAVLLGFYFRKTYRDFQDFCIALGTLLIIPPIYLTVLSSISHGQLEMLEFSWYGLTGWIFLASGLWLRNA